MGKKLKLDVKNLKLLSELEKDSRSSISRIAKVIGTSKEVANYRLKKMISSGFITRFEAVIDYSILGLDFYRLIINLHNLSYHSRRLITEDLRNMKGIDFNVYLLSDRDLEINLWVRNTKEFYDFYNEFIKKYSIYIKDKEFFIINKVYLFNHSYLHNQRHANIIGGEPKIIKLDPIDEKLIGLIEENPREEIISLAEKLHLSPSTVNYKIKQLRLKKILHKCVPVLNKNILGYNTYRVELSLSDPAKKQEVIDYLSSQHRVTKIFELLGKKDLDFYVDFQTTYELDGFLEDLRLNVPFIKDFEVINVLID